MPLASFDRERDIDQNESCMNLQDKPWTLSCVTSLFGREMCNMVVQLTYMIISLDLVSCRDCGDGGG